MVQSTGIKKINCAVFISGTGSNLKSLIQFAKKKNSPISIELIISDKERLIITIYETGFVSLFIVLLKLNKSTNIKKDAII